MILDKEAETKFRELAMRYGNYGQPIADQLLTLIDQCQVQEDECKHENQFITVVGEMICKDCWKYLGQYPPR